MDALFTYLFKYRLFYFRNGSFRFQSSPELWQLGLGLLVLALFLFWAYHRRRNLLPAAGLRLALRAAFVLLACLLLMRPSLVLSTLVPRENLVAVLVDNSRSMGIVDSTEPRGARVRDLMVSDSALQQGLEERFFVRHYRFDAQAESVEMPYELNFSGDQTNISAGLKRVLADTRNLPLAGIVLFSDGSDNSFTDFADVMGELSARQVPVHTVGLGPEKLELDAEIIQVSAPRRLLPESVATARVTIQHHGLGGARGRLEVREGASLVQSEEVRFPRDAETFTVEVSLSPKEEGLKDYQFSLQPLEGERITENNSRQTIIQVRDERPRVLYVDGSLRWEFKFIRRALEGDDNIRLETLLRTGINKFYRQGIGSESTLASGFPAEREELFEYQGVIFGSVESSFFTYPQMELVRDFVSKRGGGFLMLGGGSSYSAGKYANTPIAQILPVLLDAKSDSSYAQGKGQLAFTPHGQRHPALQLDLSASANSKRWREMPELIDWNRTAGVKPGTTILAQMAAATSTRDNNAPLLAYQRFGRGHTVALLTGSSWRWQMQLDSEDNSHARFWRQLLRWLVSLSKDKVSVESERDVYSRNELVEIRSEVHDKSYNRVNDATLEAVVRTPGGRSVTVPLRWSAREDGVYETQWAPDEEGLHQVEVTARKRGASESNQLGTAEMSFLVRTGSREYFEPSQKKDFLERLARETGGNYYSLDEVGRLPEEIIYSEQKSSRLEVLELWDMPLNFLLLVGLLFGEWLLRRRHGAI